MDGTYNDISFWVSKDGGCTATVVFGKFNTAQKHQLTLSPALVDVNYPKRGTNEIAMEIIANGTIRTGPYSYSRNWDVADCRYDVLLGML